MAVISPELEQEHSKAVRNAGLKFGAIGLAAGLAGVGLAHRRYPTFRAMTLPFKAFLVTSSGTAAGMIAADHTSINFEHAHNVKKKQYADATELARAKARAAETPYQRMMRWGRENRYSIVAGTWLAGMGVSWYHINKDRYLTTSQKVVQARVYAQALCLAALVATAVFEMSDARNGEGRWETVMVTDPKNPDQKRMVERLVPKEQQVYTGQDLWKGKGKCLCAVGNVMLMLTSEPQTWWQPRSDG